MTLEVCPTSNLKNGMVKNTAQLKDVIRRLADHEVPMTINTDGPELYDTNVYKEQQFLLKIGAMTRQEITQCNRRAFAASFIDGAHG
jgi:adenosine deaminase